MHPVRKFGEVYRDERDGQLAMPITTSGFIASDGERSYVALILTGPNEMITPDRPYVHDNWWIGKSWKRVR